MKRHIFMGAVSAVLAAGGAGDARAKTITCTGSADKTTITRVYYDASAQTCQIADGSISLQGAYDFQFVAVPANQSLQAGVDSNGDGQSAAAEALGCTLAGQTFNAGSSCYNGNLNGGTFVNSINGTNAKGQTLVMTVETLLSPQLSLETYVTVNRASVELPDEVSSGGQDGSKVVNAAAAASQTKVIATNIGTRFDAIGGDVGAVGRNTPTGGDVLEQAKQNFALSGTDRWNTSVSHTRGVAREDAARELAMMASFDSSELMLGAAQKGKTDGVLAPQDRDALLADRPVTVWGHGSYTSLDNDRLSGNEDNRYDGDVWGYNIGVDYRFSGKLYAGVSLGYSETDLTTTYNNGDYDETNWSLSPYAVYKPIEPLKLSILAGYSMGDLDLSRNNGAVTGDTDSDMWFMGLNADYTIQPSKNIPLDVVGSVGFLAAHKTVEAYQESDGTAVAKEVSNTRQAKAGIELAYTFDAKGTSIQPFTKVDFLYDFKDATNDDAFAFDIGGGLRLGNAKTGLSGSIEGETQLGRDDYKQYSISGMVAYGFSLGANGDTEASQIKPFVKSGYTQDAQEYGTGVSFVHGSGLFEADLNLSHGFAYESQAEDTTAKVGAKLNF